MKLLPCPFCGGNSTLLSSSGARVRCYHCEATGPCEKYGQPHGTEWNRRAIAASTEPPTPCECPSWRLPGLPTHSEGCPNRSQPAPMRTGESKLRDDPELRAALMDWRDAGGDIGMVLDALERAIDRRTPAAPPWSHRTTSPTWQTPHPLPAADPGPAPTPPGDK